MQIFKVVLRPGVALIAESNAGATPTGIIFMLDAGAGQQRNITSAEATALLLMSAAPDREPHR